MLNTNLYTNKNVQILDGIVDASILFPEDKPSRMSSQQFCYWLQGFFELADPKDLTPLQVQQIKDHLNLVFDKQTPVYYNTFASC